MLRLLRPRDGLYVALALIAAMLSHSYGSPVRLLRPYPVRSAYCSRWRMLLDTPAWFAIDDAQQRIHAASKRLRTDGGLELWQTPTGQWWIPGKWDHPHLLGVLLAQMERGYYGSGEWGVQPGDVVLDCGAHIGTFTRKALDSGASLVVAIEPAPAALECLRRNFAGEIRAGRVIVVPKGVWDSEGELTFHQNGNGDAAGSFVAEAVNATTITVPITTIDAISAELDLSRVDFVKADIKGATERMLRGGQRTIAQYRPRLALATEEASENAEAITRTVHGLFPAVYAMKCGPCLVDPSNVAPGAVFFRSR